MDRSTPRSLSPAAEPQAPLPPDIDDDPADESIYGTGYRTRVGAVVRDPGALEPPPAGGESPPSDPPSRS